MYRYVVSVQLLREPDPEQTEHLTATGWNVQPHTLTRRVHAWSSGSALLAAHESVPGPLRPYVGERVHVVPEPTVKED
ncbi:MAG: hypothetical protein ACRDT6_16845 [Micromonosporaceae bacterium]